MPMRALRTTTTLLLILASCEESPPDPADDARPQRLDAGLGPPCPSACPDASSPDGDIVGGVDGAPPCPPPPEGMVPPPPCTTDADCTAACPPEALGCACAAIPGGLGCVPTCTRDTDCPIPPEGMLACTPEGLCAPLCASGRQERHELVDDLVGGLLREEVAAGEAAAAHVGRPAAPDRERIPLAAVHAAGGP